MYVSRLYRSYQIILIPIPRIFPGYFIWNRMRWDLKIRCFCLFRLTFHVRLCKVRLRGEGPRILKFLALLHIICTRFLGDFQMKKGNMQRGGIKGDISDNWYIIVVLKVDQKFFATILDNIEQMFYS